MSLSRTTQNLLGTYLVSTAVVLVYLICTLWPESTAGQDGKILWETEEIIFGRGFHIHPEIRMLLVVMIIGALGSYMHAATSFVTFVGNNSLRDTWMWWYLLRPFIGMSVALIFYFSLRGGFLILSSGTDIESVNPFGMAAIAGLAGMFSKQGIDKLREMFDNMFQTAPGKGDDERSNKLNDMRPVSEIMLGIGMMGVYTFKPGETEKNITIRQLYELLRGVVTRIPILDSQECVRYVIHQSMLYKFIAHKSIESPGSSIEINKLSLQDFLSYRDMQSIVGGAMAFVPATAVLADAKQAMESMDNCQDVFVTETGKPGEPVLGWLTNVEIARHTRA